MQKSEIALAEAINEIVDERVNNILGQYVPLLERMAAFLNMPADGIALPAPRARTEHANGAKKAKRAAPARPNSPLAIAAAGAFAVDQKVLYKQGRGSFPAVIKAIEASTGSLLLERSDGKEVLRTADKVAPAPSL